MYFLCYEKRIAETVAIFDATQRTVVEDFLRSIVDIAALRSWHPDATRGLKWWRA
jgi:hypothetical protein